MLVEPDTMVIMVFAFLVATLARQPIIDTIAGVVNADPTAWASTTAQIVEVMTVFLMTLLIFAPIFLVYHYLTGEESVL